MTAAAFGRPGVVASSDEGGWYEGAGLLESAMSIKEGLADGDWFSAGAGGVSMAMGTLGAVLDPFQAIIASGLGWLMEHVECLRQPLDWLAGDPGAIEAQADTWKNIEARINTATEQFTAEVTNTAAQWRSEALAAYQRRATEHADAAAALASISGTMSTVTTVAGAIVGAVRSTVRDIIAELVAAAISKALQALGVVTIPKIVVDIGVMVTEVSTKISALISNLLTKIRGLAAVLPKVAHLMEEISPTLARALTHAEPALGQRLSHGATESFDTALGSALLHEGRQAAVLAGHGSGQTSTLGQFTEAYREISRSHEAVHGTLGERALDALTNAAKSNAAQESGKATDALNKD